MLLFIQTDTATVRNGLYGLNNGKLTQITQYEGNLKTVMPMVTPLGQIDDGKACQVLLFTLAGKAVKITIRGNDIESFDVPDGDDLHISNQSSTMHQLVKTYS